MTDAKPDQEHALEEKMRFRDLVLQVERFLKYAPKGTAPETLKREAKEFSERLAEFRHGFDLSKVTKLQARLRKIHSSGGKA